jgi:hypothetical protein
MNLTAENAKSAEVESRKQRQEAINREIREIRGKRTSSRFAFRVFSGLPLP